MKEVSHGGTEKSRFTWKKAVKMEWIIMLQYGAFLQATSRVPRWRIGERPPDMAASCDIYK